MIPELHDVIEPQTTINDKPTFSGLKSAIILLPTEENKVLQVVAYYVNITVKMMTHRIRGCCTYLAFQAPVRAGMGPIEVSVIFRNLMQRLGHNKYYVQGGDYGSAIGSVMATLFPDKILGYHTNMPMVTVNTWVSIYTILGKFIFSLISFFI